MCLCFAKRTRDSLICAKRTQDLFISRNTDTGYAVFFVVFLCFFPAKRTRELLIFHRSGTGVADVPQNGHRIHCLVFFLFAKQTQELLIVCSQKGHSVDLLFRRTDTEVS